MSGRGNHFVFLAIITLYHRYSYLQRYVPISQQSKQDEVVKIFSLESSLGRQRIMSSLPRELAVKVAIPKGIPPCD